MARRLARCPRRSSFANHLVIMAKSPQLGRVKRRLGSDIGGVAATRFYRSCLSHTVMRLARDPRWRTVLAVEPDRAIAQNLWPMRGSIVLLPQGEGDLGRRMQRLFALLPPGPAIIVGGDIPAIGPKHIAEAFRLLGQADAVLGPALDGGYWLVGLRTRPRLLRLFAGVRWSTPYALADTVANLDGKRVAFAATLCDVDTRQTYLGQSVLAGRLVVNVPRLRAHLI
jgi:rSAM/selenodomain-associated transferase 1